MSPTDSPERRDALRKALKRMGCEFSDPKCAICKKVFSEDEILNEDFIYSVSRNGNIQFCRECFRKEFFRGGKVTHAVLCA